MALPDHPYQRISIDWFSYEQAFNGLTGCTIIKCDLTSVTTVVPGEGKNTIGPAITQLDTRVHRQYGFRICQVRSDNEPALGNAFPAWCKREGIDWIPSSTYTSAQNGGAERAGGVIIRISTSIRIAARLPEDYWPESTVTAAYLHNLIPTETNGWKSPLVTLKEAINAFTNSPLDEEIYVDWPPGYKNASNSRECLRLHKALYGLRRSPLL